MVKNRIGVWSAGRTCANCRETFDTERGLRLHQKNKIKVGCYRAGLKKKIWGVKAARASHFEKVKGRVIPKLHGSVAAKRPHGQNISAGEKQIILNVYDYFCNQGHNQEEVKSVSQFPNQV